MAAKHVARAPQHRYEVVHEEAPGAKVTDPVVPTRGRRRNHAIDESVRAATKALLLEGGYAGVNFDAVARRANISRPTLYRRFASKAELVFHVLFVNAIPESRVPDTGHFESDIRELVARTVEVYDRPEIRAGRFGLLDDLAGRGSRHELHEWYDRFLAQTAEMLARAVERGEASDRVDADVLMHLIQGAVIQWVSSETDHDRFAEQLTHVVVKALAPEPRNPRRRRR